MVEWKIVDAVLKDADGNIIFEQKDVEAPVGWSDRAIRIVAQKYFRGKLGTPERETSVRQIITRVIDTIHAWLIGQGYFSESDADLFRNDLAYLLLTQRGAFNSPVWFNLGVPREPQQCSACFIQAVGDDMKSIAQLQMDETMVFKLGSGSGTNLSNLRSSREHLRGGGTASGPVSFMRGFDSWAGVIKSGGKTRRAAKMVILNVDHPDIVEFIDSKVLEERRAHALIAAGFSADFDDPQGAYASAAFQNANHSVRVTDDFMDMVEYAQDNPDAEVLWDLTSVKTGEVLFRIPVLELWNKICAATWFCGDPGMQFDTTINDWHTCPTDGRINSSNPCSEYMFLDDSACNLASLNVLKFRREDGTFDQKSFCEAANVFIIAQEAMVDQAHYPTRVIADNSSRFRPLGLGYANLGAYLMSVGLAYDSDEGRRVAAEITSMMGAQAYITSSFLAACKGPFDAFSQNRGAMLHVIDKHREAAAELGLESMCLWDQAAEGGEEHGFRNAQVTLLAPTGTIGFLMDCETTGIEPDASLYKVKQLVGGGTLVMENRVVELALAALEYTPSKQAKILQWLGDNQCLDGCPHLASKHMAVFDCAIPSKGKRVLGLNAHLKMTAAVQPFLSGAISKTMNLPHATTPEQIGDAYLEAWRLGIKAVALYRDGCKLSQPLVTAQREKEKKSARAIRRRLEDHQTNCHRIKFRFGDVKGYLIATPYEDTGMPGEIFVEWAKEGSTVSGLVDGWAQAISYCLQYGVPLEALVGKYSHTKFEPSGFSTDPDIRFANSIYDALMRKLAAVFLDKQVTNGHTLEDAVEQATHQIQAQKDEDRFSALDNPVCTVCGAITVSSGANCYKCNVCGSASGCG
jgi:ribonucleoside-diphosphate reductase alpha chain